jgi:hypothetical protein
LCPPWKILASHPPEPPSTPNAETVAPWDPDLGVGVQRLLLVDNQCLPQTAISLISALSMLDNIPGLAHEVQPTVRHIHRGSRPRKVVCVVVNIFVAKMTPPRQWVR